MVKDRHRHRPQKDFDWRFVMHSAGVVPLDQGRHLSVFPMKMFGRVHIGIGWVGGELVHS